jgi:tetraacyldisaccharide 4'-kinase
LNWSGDYYRDLVTGRKRGLWPSLLRGGLRLACMPYDVGSRLRNGLYDWGWKQSRKVAAPVVSVGNLTLGGTGKTPCVEYVAGFYRQRDLRVAIVSRGYGSQSGCNDEALVLEENLPDVPHLQGPDRAGLAQAALEELESEVLVLDDGFQHRRLARDLDIVLIDATDPWSQGYLFPRGLLRESPRGLGRAHAVLLTRCDQVSTSDREDLRKVIKALAPQASFAMTRHRAVELVNGDKSTPLSMLDERPVAAFCGIGNPEAFRRTLTDLGVAVKTFRTYADHHAYTRKDVDELRAWARQQATDCVVVTTQKDLVKLRLTRLGPLPLWALRVRLHFDTGQQEFDCSLSSVIDKQLCHS